MNLDRQHPLSIAQAVRLGVRDAFGVPFIVLLASMTAFGSLARDSGLTIELALVSTIGIWALPGQIVFAELYAAGSDALALILAVSLANARFFPMVMSILPLLRDEVGRTARLYLYAHCFDDALNKAGEAHPQRPWPRGVSETGGTSATDADAEFSAGFGGGERARSARPDLGHRGHLCAATTCGAQVGLAGEGRRGGGFQHQGVPAPVVCPLGFD